MYAVLHLCIQVSSHQAPYPLKNSGQIHAQAVRKLKDEEIARTLKEVRQYLPSVHRPGGGQTSDYLVHPTALAHLRRRFNFVSSSLLRNDSLSDMSDRSLLYFELFEWLEVSEVDATNAYGTIFSLDFRPSQTTRRSLR